jgi:hypothetical protein
MMKAAREFKKYDPPARLKQDDIVGTIVPTIKLEKQINSLSGGAA